LKGLFFTAHKSTTTQHFVWTDFFSAGFLEYLLDRKTETDKAGKEMKYELISELVRSPFSKEVFDKPFHLRLREYEREGPFYVQAQAAVAFEGAD